MMQSGGVPVTSNDSTEFFGCRTLILYLIFELTGVANKKFGLADCAPNLSTLRASPQNSIIMAVGVNES